MKLEYKFTVFASGLAAIMLCASLFFIPHPFDIVLSFIAGGMILGLFNGIDKIDKHNWHYDKYSSDVEHETWLKACQKGFEEKILRREGYFNYHDKIK